MNERISRLMDGEVDAAEMDSLCGDAEKRCRDGDVELLPHDR